MPVEVVTYYVGWAVGLALGYVIWGMSPCNRKHDDDAAH